jgi:hypothetical protein
LAAGCTPTGNGSGDDDADDGIDVPVPSVTAPPTRLTPFCQAMLELDGALPDDPAIDTREQILEAYRAAQPLVPEAIAAEFVAVIEALETGTAPLAADVPATTLPATTEASVVTGDRFFEEGYLPDDNPAVRVNEYIDFACRGTQNNPGPPATQPGGVPTTVDGG